MDYRDDAVFISSLIPWLNCPEEIKRYIATIPDHQQHLTLQLTLKHFFEAKDQLSSLNSEILGEALDIARVFPNVSRKKIRSRLLTLGNIPNRKEVVLRQLLQTENGNLLASTTPPKQNPCSCNNETNINIKIRKLDGTLKIITNAKQTTSETLTVNPANEIPSSTSISAIPETLTVDCYSPLRETGSDDDFIKGLQLMDSNEVDKTEKTPSVSDSIAYMDYIFRNNSEYLDLLEAANVKDNPPPEPERVESSFKERDGVTEQENDANPLSGAIRAILGWEDHNDILSTSPSTSVPSAGSSETIIQDIDENIGDDTSLPDALREYSSHFNSDSSPTISSLMDDISSLDNNSDYRSRSPTPEFEPDVVFIGAEVPRRSSQRQLVRDYTLPIDMTTERNDLKRKHAEVSGMYVYKKAGSSTVGAASTHGPVTIPSPPKLKKTLECDPTLVSRLSEMFPETCTDYIKQLCQSKHWNHFEEIVERILENPDHPKRQVKQREITPPPQISNEDQLKIVKEILPDADPTFLEIQCEKLNYDAASITQFIEDCRERRNYPTLKEYLRKQQLSAQSKQYTEEFNVEKFIELFPNPEETFSDPTRKIDLNEYSMRYIKVFFENKFNRLHKRTIQKALNDYDYKILKIDAYLQDCLNQNVTMKSQRKKEPIIQTEQNILLLQELAYVTHKDEILYHIEMKKKQDEQKRQHAKANGLMNTCACCFNDEVMPEDTYHCPKTHPFCRECIETSCGIALGEGRTQFNCLTDCTEEFPLVTLQKVLPPKMFSTLARKQALAEIKAAGLDNLEMCPFCDFASIPNPLDKVFRCLNPECMKESCRECKEPSHLPLRCDEIEKDENVKARIHIENKMTEALLRKCCKCGTSFFKEEGCNKMTCVCGAVMCYICNKPVQDYKHFNGIGGDKFNLCPLYSDTNQLNKIKVLQAAQVAKQEVGAELKVDPTADIEEHFEKRRKELGTPPYLNVLERQELPRNYHRRYRRLDRREQRRAQQAMEAMLPHYPHNH